jgi:3D (Asp-Asp-Asp) domain-containing protein
VDGSPSGRSEGCPAAQPIGDLFRIDGLNNDEEARGAQGVPLSAERSVAVDNAVFVYGTPSFIEANLGSGPYRRTMIAQDTGSAIVGPARADIYFGAGEEAARKASSFRQSGRITMLLPRTLASAAAASGVPLPLPRPTIAMSSHWIRPPAMTVVSSEKEVRNRNEC